MPWVATLAMSQAAPEPLLHRIAASILAVAQQKYLNSKWSHLEQFHMPAEVHRNEQILQDIRAVQVPFPARSSGKRSFHDRPRVGRFT